MTDLALCPVCQRHVRATDSRCPFCDSPARSGAIAAVAAAGLALTSCFPTSVYGPPPAPAYGPPPMERHCPASDTLITMDWPPSERADLEVAAHAGAVVLHRAGCEVEVLRQCTAPGAYQYQSVKASKSEVVVHSTEELSRLLPTNGHRISRFAQKPEGFTLTAVSVGQLKLDALPARGALRGECDRATHVVTAIRVGAFQVAAGKEGLLSGGDASACEASEPGATEPPKSCSELIRLDLAPLSER